MKDKLKRYLPALISIPFLVGSAGYIVAGNRITDSFYASLSLYSMSPVLDSYNIWIEIARWTAPLGTAAVVLSVFENLWKNVLWWFHSLSGDSVAVYTDLDIHIIFDKKTWPVYSKKKIKRHAKSHIILMSSDLASMKFYGENKDKLSGGSVYIGLREIEYGLMKEESEVIFFDVNGAVSRLLWKQIRLWEEQKQNLSIVIWGKGYLAENILSCGLLLNLYSKEQQIKYHMVGNDSFLIKHPQFLTMNHDKIIFHSEQSSESWEVVRKADVIIIAEEVSTTMLQALAVNGMNAQIYYYSHTPDDTGECLQLTNLKPFGRDEDIYTDQNIRQKKLVEAADNLNQIYAKKYNGETDWRRLSGFLKWSNISAADFNRILTELLRRNPEADVEIFAELEHIRWCRFHFLNYWTYGEPADGRNKDSERRIHRCLCAYDELSPEDRKKDKDVVEEARKKIGEYDILEKDT